jgi:hypothetical protein
VIELAGEPLGDFQGPISARIVRYDYLPGERKIVSQKTMQLAHRNIERGSFVVDG